MAANHGDKKPGARGMLHMSDERVNQLTLELAKCRQQNREILAEREGFVRELAELRERNRTLEAQSQKLTAQVECDVGDEHSPSGRRTPL